MFYSLTPSGDVINLKQIKDWNEYFSHLFVSRSYELYGSGTESLSASLIAARDSKELLQPEVILPAYGCPDLVSAVLYAGCKPVLIDVKEDRPWIDISNLISKINENTLAIITVDLFGIPERFEKLQNISREYGVFLIQDSAQGFPFQVDNISCYGDMTILSFGRGKPVSVLAGGLLLTHSTNLQGVGASTRGRQKGVEQLLYRAKLLAYNVLSSPWLYWAVIKLPFLNLGETRFAPLKEISKLPDYITEYIPGNIEIHKHHGTLIQKEISAMLARINSPLVVDLPKACDLKEYIKLNRYPLLIKNKHLRGKMYKMLIKRGLGVSRMYPTTLNKLSGLEKYFDSNDCYPCAEQFSNEILTLPTHSRVSKNTVTNIERSIVEVLNSY